MASAAPDFVFDYCRIYQYDQRVFVTWLGETAADKCNVLPVAKTTTNRKGTKNALSDVKCSISVKEYVYIISLSRHSAKSCTLLSPTEDCLDRIQTFKIIAWVICRYSVLSHEVMLTTVSRSHLLELLWQPDLQLRYLWPFFMAFSAPLQSARNAPTGTLVKERLSGSSTHDQSPGRDPRNTSCN
jgi:hypothetical protein